MRWQRLSVARKTPGFGGALNCISENSDVDLDDSAHVVQLERVFREANRHRMAIVVHMRSNTKRTLGAGQARVFLQELLPAAANIPIQIAHMALGDTRILALMPQSAFLPTRSRPGISA